MICYKDMTFCIQGLCKKPCKKKLTDEIKKKAEDYGLPIMCSEYTCIDCGEEETNEPQTMS